MERYLEKEITTAFKELKPVLKDDNSYLKMKPIEEVKKTIDLLGSLFIRYLKAVNSLTEIHNYTLNPLKRECLKDVMEKLFARILEIKNEMVDTEKSDFQYLDTIILQNCITPNNVALKIPLYFRDQREELIKNLYEKIDMVLYRKEHPEEFMETEESDEDLEQSTRHSTVTFKADRRSTARETRSTLRDQSEFEAQDQKQSVRKSSFKAAAKRPRFKTSFVQVFEYLNEIKLIQRHERARAARVKTQIIKEENRRKMEIAWLIYKPVPLNVAEKAAETIQSHYMSYKNRRWKKYLKAYQGLTYGTLVPSYRDKTDVNEINTLLEKRKKLQNFLKVDMLNKEELMLEEMKVMKKYEIIEDLTTELRAFIRRWYDFTKAFGYTEVPEWPTDEEIIPPARVLGIPEGLPKYYIQTNFPEMDYTKIGSPPTTTLAGSELITANYWIPVEQYVTAAEMSRYILSKGLPQEDAEKNAQALEAEKEKEEQKKEEERLRMEELMRRGHVPWESNYLKDLIALVGEFVQTWGVGKQHSAADDEAYVEEKLKIDATYRIMKQVRKDVDSQMRKELKILKAAIEKDNEDREPVPKIVQKKAREKKKKGKKPKKDPLANRTSESLFEELTEEGIVIKCKPIDIDSLPGQYNFHAQEARIRFEEPIPAMGEVYQVAKLFVALPLASQVVREHNTPIKSILLIGPDRLTHPLVHGLVQSIGALLIYLPALNFTKRFKPKILLRILLKVAKEYEPSILMIDGAEKPFYKKVPKNEKPMKPGTLKGIIPKLIKGIKPSDRIVVLGTAEKPWLSKPKLASSFQKILICPGSDYHCMSALVQKTIMAYHGVDREFDTSVISAMFMGRELEEVENRLKSIFTTERKIRLLYDPLKIEEIGCIEKEASKDTSLEDWYNRNYRLNKARKKMLEAEREKAEREAKLKDNAEKRKTLLNNKK